MSAPKVTRSIVSNPNKSGSEELPDEEFRWSWRIQKDDYSQAPTAQRWREHIPTTQRDERKRKSMQSRIQWGYRITEEMPNLKLEMKNPRSHKKKSVENSTSGMNQMENSVPGPEGKVE